jgi:flagellar protein FlaJ
MGLFTKKQKIKRPVKGLSEITKLSMVTTAVGIMIIYINFMFFSAYAQIFALINMLGAIIILGIPLFFRYSHYKTSKKMESIFPKFLRDIAENVSTGMTLPQAMRAVATHDYGIMTPYVKDISAKISWGVPMEKVLTDFANKVGTDIMKRNIQSIIETHRSGGSIDTIMSAVAESSQELEKIKKERSASVYSQMINGYMIYVVFLGVMIALSSVLIPAFQFEGSQENLQAAFKEIFRSLIIIQGFFAGLSIGKMTEGELMAGIKHSIVLVVFGYSAFILAG